MNQHYRALRIESSFSLKKLDKESRIELYIPKDGNICYDEDCESFSVRECGRDLVLVDYVGRIGLPKGIAFDFCSTYIDLVGVLNSPANISGTGGNVNLVIPTDSELDLCVQTAGNLKIDNDIFKSRGYKFFGKDFYAIRDEYSEQLLSRLQEPKLLDSSDEIAFDFSSAEDKGVSDLEVCIKYGLIKIHKTGASVNIYHRDLVQKPKTEQEKLQMELGAAIEKEDYMLAAKLRDKLNLVLNIAKESIIHPTVNSIIEVK